MESLTTEKISTPQVKQFTIFLPNKLGAFAEIVKQLHECHIEVLGIDIQESADCAIVRIVVSDPEQAQEFFDLRNIPFTVSQVLVVELRNGAHDFPKLLSALFMAEVNTHGSYGLLSRPNGITAIALHVEDNECAAAVLTSHDMRVLSQGDISR